MRSIARIQGYKVLTTLTRSFLPCAYSFSAANQGGHTKKVTMNAILLMSFCLVRTIRL
jgi:hypothetical protein